MFGLQGVMPLHFAAQNGDAAMVELLLSHGADAGAEHLTVSLRDSIKSILLNDHVRYF